MSRTLFENSKAALAFAAVTIVGAVSMVGTSEDTGVLSAVVQKFGTKHAEQASAGQIRSETPSQGEGPAPESTPTSVFGSYTGTPPLGTQPTGTQPTGTVPIGTGGMAPAPHIANPMTAPVAPTAIPH